MKRIFGRRVRNVFLSVAMVTGTLTGFAVAAAGPAAAVSLSSFIDINPTNATIQYDGTGTAGWANSGPVVSTCDGTNGTKNNGGVNLSGTNGLFNCGAAVPIFPATAAEQPQYNSALGAANGVFDEAFIQNQTNTDVTNCGGGTTATGSNLFGGGEKFTDDPGNDSYSIGQATGKDQIGNVYAVARRDPTNGDNELYVGLERLVNNGNTHADFEFLQENVSETTPCTGTFTASSPGNPAGVHEQGDISLEINFGLGGTNPAADVLVWSCTGALPTTVTVGTPCSGSNPSVQYPNATWVQESPCSTVGQTGCYDPSSVAIGTNANNMIPCGGWVCRTPLLANDFMEGAIDIDAFSGFSVGCAATFFPLTRSAGSGVTSQIKSFAPPVKFDTCQPTTTTTKAGKTSLSLGDSTADTATVTRSAGTGTPTGTVTFYACPVAAIPAVGPDCDPNVATTTLVGTSPLSASTPTSATAVSPSFQPTSTGTWCFSAYYKPAGGNKLQPSADNGANECFTVKPAVVPFTTSIVPPGAAATSVGNSWGDKATVSGTALGGVPSGSVTFSWCSTPTTSPLVQCSGGTTLATVTAPDPTLTSGDNATWVLPAADAFTPKATGSYCFTDSYSGDKNYGQVGQQTDAECFTVEPAGTTSSSQVTPTSVAIGPAGTVTDTVTVSGNAIAGPPTGNVTFEICQVPAAGPCSGGTAVSANGSLKPAGASTSTVSSQPFQPTSVGIWCFGAVYKGDSNYTSSQDNTTAANADVNECVTVNKAPVVIATDVYNAGTNTLWGATTPPTGASAYDTATVTGNAGVAPGGTFDYVLYPNGTCTGASTSTQSVTLSGGNVPNSSQTAPLAAGTYGYLDTYSGDGVYLGGTGSCEVFTVAPATPRTQTQVEEAGGSTPWTGTEPTGSAAHDTATITGVPGFTPSGSVTYNLYSGSSCSGGTITTQTVNLSGGVVPASNDTGALAAGTYSYGDTYSGDQNYNATAFPCEPLTVARANPSTATQVNDAATGAAWAGTETTGAKAYDTASVSGVLGFVPSGTATYTLYQGGTCNGTVVGAPQTVTLTGTGAVPNSATTAPLGAGTYSYSDTYSGDQNYNPEAFPCEPFTVAKASSAANTTVYDATTSKPWTGSETSGSSAYDTSDVTGVAGFAPTGTVDYQLYTGKTCAGTLLSDQTANVGQPSPPYGPLSQGTYSYLATYSGDSNYSGTTAVCEVFSVGLSPTTLGTTVDDASTGGAWVSPEPLGSTSEDTSTLGYTGPLTPTGSVTYYLFDNASCTGTPINTSSGALSGGRPGPSAVSSPLGAGPYSYLAEYLGDADFAASTASCEPISVAQGSSKTQTVVDEAGGAKAWNNTETTGSEAQDTATVTGIPAFAPSGTVTYTLYEGSSCSGTQISTETVKLSGGSVPDSSATAPLAAGSYSYIDHYSGDTNYTGSDGSCEVFSVVPAPSSVSTTVYDAATGAAWAGTETTGAAAYDTSSVSGVGGFVPTGTVTYTLYDTGACSGTVLGTSTVAVGKPSSSSGALGAGKYSYLATYGGDPNYLGSSAKCEPFDMAQAASSTATAVEEAGGTKPWTNTETVGSAAHDTATVTGVAGFTPSGTVTYTLYQGSCSGTKMSTETVTLAGGVVPSSSNTSALPAGSYSYIDHYSGDTNYLPSDGACEPFSVGRAGSSTSTAVNDAATNAAWSDTEVSGARAYDTASVGGALGFAPSGTVTYVLYKGTSCTGSPISSNQVTMTAIGSVPNSPSTGALAAGGYSYADVYSGDSNYSGAAGACEPFTVGPAASSVTTIVEDATTNAAWTNTEAAGASALDTSTVTGVAGFAPTGTVTYVLYSTGSCTGTSISTVSAPVGAPSTASGALAAGSYSYLATYSGDSNYLGSAAACEPFSVLVPPILSATKSSNPADGSSVTPGSTIVYTITLSNAGALPAMAVTVTDQVPAHTTFVSATNGGVLGTGSPLTVSWTNLSVPAEVGTSPGVLAVSFTVTVDSGISGVTIPNVAYYTNANSPNCATAALCPTNTVRVSVPTTLTPPTLAPARHVVVTTTVPPPTVVPPTAAPASHVLAFTGAYFSRIVTVAGAAVVAGLLLLLSSRRRRRAG